MQQVGAMHQAALWRRIYGRIVGWAARRHRPGAEYPRLERHNSERSAACVMPKNTRKGASGRGIWHC